MSALLMIAVVSAVLLFIFAGVFIWGSLERAGETTLPKPRRRSF